MGKDFNNNKINFSFYIPIILAAASGFFPLKLMFFVTIIITGLFIREFIKDKNRDNPSAPMYVYVTGFILFSALILYFLGVSYLNLKKNNSLFFLSISILAGVIFMVLHLRAMLKSENEDLIARAKISIFIFSVCGIFGIILAIGILTMK